MDRLIRQRKYIENLTKCGEHLGLEGHFSNGNPLEKIQIETPEADRLLKMELGWVGWGTERLRVPHPGNRKQEVRAMGDSDWTPPCSQP